MITLISICDLFWLLWLLPFLLGALLWWLANNKYKKMVSDYETKNRALDGKITGFRKDLEECRHKRSSLEGDLSIANGRVREIQAQMDTQKASTQQQITAATADATALANSKILELQTELNDIKASAVKQSEIKNLSAGPALHTSNLAETSTTSSPVKPEAPVSSGSGKKSVYGGIKADNLQIIEGIGPKMESVLKENNVNTHSDLANTSVDGVQAILNKYGDKYKIIDPETWPQQAKFAQREDYDGLIELQKKLDGGKSNAIGESDSKLEKYLIKTGAIKSLKQDDLKAIEGIGPATEKLLHENGIKTWRDLANASADNIKTILTAAGSRFALGDPTTWPKQAELAANGEYEKLREYQDFLDGGKA